LKNVPKAGIFRKRFALAFARSCKNTFPKNEYRKGFKTPLNLYLNKISKFWKPNKRRQTSSSTDKFAELFIKLPVFSNRRNHAEIVVDCKKINLPDDSPENNWSPS